jgi:hypothetical protein
VKPKVPQIVVVICKFPSRYTRKKSVHNDELLDFCGELSGIGVCNHQADVVPDNRGLRNADRFRERMNANGRRLNVAASLGNIGVADAWQVRGDYSESVLKFVYERAPHPRGLRIAVQKDQGRTLSRCEVVKLLSFDLCNPRPWGFVRFSTSLHFIVLQKRWLQPKSIDQTSGRKAASGVGSGTAVSSSGRR